MKTMEVFQNVDKTGKKNKELGASLVEYGLLIAMVALIAVPAVKAVGNGINPKLDYTAKQIGSTDFNGGCDINTDPDC